jgi:hypothetical protein
MGLPGGWRLKMANADLGLLRHLVAEEIRRAVADGIADGGCLSAGDHAARIHNTYPTVGLSADDIYMDIAEAAARAGVALELARPWAVPPAHRKGIRRKEVAARSSGRP